MLNACAREKNLLSKYLFCSGAAGLHNPVKNNRKKMLTISFIIIEMARTLSLFNVFHYCETQILLNLAHSECNESKSELFHVGPIFMKSGHIYV